MNALTFIYSALISLEVAEACMCTTSFPRDREPGSRFDPLSGEKCCYLHSLMKYRFSSTSTSIKACLLRVQAIPLESWDEWRQIACGGGRGAARIVIPGVESRQRTFAAAYRTFPGHLYWNSACRNCISEHSATSSVVGATAASSL